MGYIGIASNQNNKTALRNRRDRDRYTPGILITILKGREAYQLLNPGVLLGVFFNTDKNKVLNNQ